MYFLLRLNEREREREMPMEGYIHICINIQENQYTISEYFSFSSSYIFLLLFFVGVVTYYDLLFACNITHTDVL